MILKDITLIVLCAGKSTRFQLSSKKQWIRCNDEPLWLNVTNRLSNYVNFKNIILTAQKDEINYMKNLSSEYLYVIGGSTRLKSIKNALQKVTTKYVMITDVARCCIPNTVIDLLIKNKNKADCIVPYISISDTVVYKNNIINRDKIKIIQTPQLSKTSILNKALSTNMEFTDDSSAIKFINGSIHYIDGDKRSLKLTYSEELSQINCLPSPSQNIFTGIGYDIHPFENNKLMMLGGVKIDVPYGFKAHSDGDVLIHSLIDALLGACGAGDIGEFFPDNNKMYKNIDSKKLLNRVYIFVANVGYEIINIDITIIAQIPKINPYKDKIKSMLSTILKIPKIKLNIKATTSEKLGFIGREEGVAVQSIATLKFYDWKNTNENINIRR
jgi:2-C-methyl-D-erythritol 4-phosphate cytidylyltransferase/2-C-methyl-D-erythritol 2,4-cyclodiphosphate synthase